MENSSLFFDEPSFSLSKTRVIESATAFHNCMKRLSRFKCDYWFASLSTTAAVGSLSYTSCSLWRQLNFNFTRNEKTCWAKSRFVLLHSLLSTHGNAHNFKLLMQFIRASSRFFFLQDFIMENLSGKFSFRKIAKLLLGNFSLPIKRKLKTLKMMKSTSKFKLLPNSHLLRNHWKASRSPLRQ